MNILIKGKLLLIFILINLSFVCRSQETEWLRINPLPFESTIESATIIPGTNKIVAVGDYATLMSSVNNGEDWTLQRRPAGIPYSSMLKSVHFPSQTHGYILGNNSLLLKSTDSGMSWEDISLEGNYNHQEVYFNDDEIGFITGGKGYILRTGDGGITWDTIETSPGITAGSLHFINDSKGFMGNTLENYYFMTMDEGLNWDTISFIPFSENQKVAGVHFIDDTTGFVTSFDTNYHDRIYKTIDGGFNWYEVYNNGLYWPKDFYFVSHDKGFALGSTQMYVDCIFRTTDCGETWIMDDDFSWHLNSLVFSQDQVGLLFGTFSRIYRSFNMGMTWEQESPTVFRSHFYAAEMLNDSVIIAGGQESPGGVPSGRIIRSEDSGWTWVSVCYTLGQVTDIHFVDDQTGYAVTMAGSFYKTTDGGNTWDDGIEISYAEFYAVCFTSPTSGFVAGVVGPWDWEESVFKTTDGGETWQRLDTASLYMAGTVYDICFANELTGYLAGEIEGPGGTGPGGVMKTIDGGNNWFFLDLDLGCYDVTDVECVGENIVYVTGCDFILKSQNAGATWSYLSVPGENSVKYHSVSFLDENVGIAVGAGPDWNMIKTTDGGNSWEIMESPTPAPLTCARFFEEDKGLIFGNSGVIFKLDTGYIVAVEQENPQIITDLPVKLYPNPVYDLVKIKFSGKNTSSFTLEVYSILGEKILSRNSISPEGTYNLSLKELPDGIYLVIARNEKERFQTKIIKINP